MADTPERNSKRTTVADFNHPMDGEDWGRAAPIMLCS
jgi:hypothetical protein